MMARFTVTRIRVVGMVIVRIMPMVMVKLADRLPLSLKV